MASLKFRMTERQVLLLIMGACLAAYAAAFLFLGLRRKPEPADSAERSVAYWMPPQTQSEPQKIEYVVADLLDPSLMSLPSIHGFSRQLWERQSPARRRNFEPGVKFAFFDAGIPNEIQPLLQQPSLSNVVQVSAEKSSAQSEENADTELAAPPPDRSVVRVIEGIDNFTILQSPELPTITSDAPLRPTRVRIAAVADGTVRYAVLDRSSGNDATAAQADARALDLAQQIRFEPHRSAAASALTWGVLEFVWATASSPVATNEIKAAQP